MVIKAQLLITQAKTQYFSSLFVSQRCALPYYSKSRTNKMKLKFSAVICFLAIITPFLAAPVSKNEYNGDATFYYPTGLGACGSEITPSDFIAALAAEDFDPFTPNHNPNNNCLCGSLVEVNFNGKSVNVTIVDRCVGCKSGDIDLSPAAFEELADLDIGRIKVSWKLFDKHSK